MKELQTYEICISCDALCRELEVYDFRYWLFCSKWVAWKTHFIEITKVKEVKGLRFLFLKLFAWLIVLKEWEDIGPLSCDVLLLTFVLSLGRTEEWTWYETFAAISASDVEPISVVLVQNRHEFSSIHTNIAFFLNSEITRIYLLRELICDSVSDNDFPFPLVMENTIEMYRSNLFTSLQTQT